MQDYYSFLKGLTGKWEGTGWAEYPTIKNSEYREELIFSTNEKDRVVHYEQKTWIEEPEPLGEQPIFWECGFFVFKNEGIFLVNSQKSGRMENMKVEMNWLNSGELQVIATLINCLNDSRILNSKRVFEFSEEKISYQLFMGTTMTGEQLVLHLQAELEPISF